MGVSGNLGAMLDLKAFWEENHKSSGKAFRTDKPRAPIGISVDDHWLIDEMKVPSTLRYYNDGEYQARINRECNDRCEAAIGLRPFSELPPTLSPLRIEHLFGSHTELTEGGTPWLEPGHDSIESFAAKLDELDRVDILELALSNGAVVEKTGGEGHAWSRGPTTVACSVLGPEQFLYWMVDEPELMHRYFDTFVRAHTAYHGGLAQLRGAKITGCAWLDDFCVLLSPSLHREFALPAMKACMDAFPGYRFQHSDSAMEHLLPVLAECDYHGVNFGPTVPVRAIRDAMPGAEIQGQVPPFLLRDGTVDELRDCIRRDFAEVGGDGGMVITTAGSVAAGTTLDKIRAFMEIVQEDCRY